jgi:hypothetical protein
MESHDIAPRLRHFGESHVGVLFVEAVWPAPSFIDTLFGAMMHNEVSYGTKAFYSRVQA